MANEYKGVNYTNMTATPIVKALAGEVNVKKRLVFETYVTAALVPADTEEILLPFLPEGAHITGAYLKTDATAGATGTLSIGLKAHVNSDGDAVALDVDSLVPATVCTGGAVLAKSTAASVALGTKIGIGGAQPSIYASANFANAGVNILAVIEYGIE